MVAQLGGEPILVLPAETVRLVGRDARRSNIIAVRVIAETVRSTLGPRGMDKMLVSDGDIVITNDGATILKSIDVTHPAAKMIIEIAKTQEREAGDGTTSVVVIAGELLKRAEELLDQDVHAGIIAKGFIMAKEKALEILKNKAKKATKEDYLKVAITALNSKAPGITAKDHIASLALEAVLSVADKNFVSKGRIKIQKVSGGATCDSEVVRGIVIEKEVAHPLMPKIVRDAKVAVLGFELKVKKTEISAKLSITSPEKLREFMEAEEREIKDVVERLAEAGAKVVFCQKDIDDMALHFLAKKNIMAVKSVSEKDIKAIAKATNAVILKSARDINEKDLGFANIVEERKIGAKRYIFIKNDKTKAVTILVRGGSEHILAETERSLDDAISVIKDVYEDGYIVAGGGAIEMELSKELRKFAKTISGREQLAVEAFADALEVIPRTLAENAGLDPIEIALKLRSEHEKGNESYGIDIFSKEVKDMFEAGILEPIRVKEKALKFATEAAIMILRIDDVIAAKGAFESKKEEKEEKTQEFGGF